MSIIDDTKQQILKDFKAFMGDELDKLKTPEEKLDMGGAE